MFITVQFHKGNTFTGKTYDYEVDNAPKKGSIIRMLSSDGTKFICNGTRVKVVDVKSEGNARAQHIDYILATMDEQSFSEL